MPLSLAGSSGSSSIGVVALDSGVEVEAMSRSAGWVAANTALGGVGSAGESRSRRELVCCEGAGVGAAEALYASLGCC